MKVAVAIYGRDEAEILPQTLEALFQQSHPLDKVFYVDDASVDGSADVAEKYGAHTIRLLHRHLSWVELPQLSKIANECIEAIYTANGLDYFCIVGADTILPKDYMADLLERVQEDSRIVVCSGRIKGEFWVPTSPRGSGRLFSFKFWDRYVKRYPLCFAWESYPVYKALQLGFKTVAFPDVEMYVQRETRTYKTAAYGYAMREMGYLPTHALWHCIATSLKSRKKAFKMFYNYLTLAYPPYDEDIRRWVRSYQIRRILRLIYNPKKIKQLVRRYAEVVR